MKQIMFLYLLTKDNLKEEEIDDILKIKLNYHNNLLDDILRTTFNYHCELIDLKILEYLKDNIFNNNKIDLNKIKYNIIINTISSDFKCQDSSIILNSNNLIFSNSISYFTSEDLFNQIYYIIKNSNTEIKNNILKNINMIITQLKKIICEKGQIP